MNSSRSEIEQRIRALTASGRRDRRKAAELVRLKGAIESVTDSLLLARSRCDVLEKRLDHAEKRADAAKISELHPQIMNAVAERNVVQKNFLKLTARLRKRFGIEIETPAPENTATVEATQNV